MHRVEGQWRSSGALGVLRSSGQVGRDLLLVDWDATPLGAPDRWSSSLATVLRTMLGSRFAMWMAWGPELTFFCNEAYRRDTLGLKYPRALGRPAAEVWAEIWDDIGPRIDSVLETGQATWDEALMLVLERSGFREETYHTFSYSALSDDDDRVVGMLCVVAEETERVIAERRMGTLNALASALSSVHTETEVHRAVESALADNRADLPFTLTYLSEPASADAARPRLAASTGVPPRHPLIPVLSAGLQTPVDGSSVVVELDPAVSDAGLSGAWGVPPAAAAVVPLAQPGREQAAGFLVAGLNPHRPADEAAISFVELVGGQIASAVAGARAYEAERRRAEQLAELDRAKTAFFTNVSHEFRTPLTLLLGPLSDALASDGPEQLPSVQADRLRLAQRNAARLLALVNTLLDFNRLQAGGLQPELEPVDLPTETVEVASMFRSAIEAGGVKLVIDCDGLDRPVLIDRRMWEQIVTNLISNAFKHTLEGRIDVALRAAEEHVELRISDTGEGIPEPELPRIFERFHRVESTRARTIEGSGIGLALVRELVELHHGTISVESRLGEGTSVRVELPAASAPVTAAGVPAAVPLRDLAAARVAELEGWLSRPAPHSEAAGGGRPDAESILVVDDNRDMREYLVRLLSGDYEVRAAASGLEALAALDEVRPDLVVSDVMMPDMDGRELLRRLRARTELADVPVILLSARAGADAAVEGLDLGADDYVVKPFTAEDLLGRVRARMAAGRDRRRRQVLTDLAAALGGAQPPEAILAAVGTLLRSELDCANATLAVIEGDGTTLRYRHAWPYGRGIELRWHFGPMDGPAPSATAVRERRTIALESPDEVAPLGAIADEWRLAGIEAELAVPLLRPTGEPVGCLVAVWSSARAVGPDDRRFVEGVALLAAEALERWRALRVEQRLVDQLQERLLDVDVRVPVATIQVRYVPADAALLVGGDWYDVTTVGRRCVGLAVGDVVGRGIGAAAVMSQLRSALAMAAVREQDPSMAVDQVSAFAARLPEALGSTLVYVVLNEDRTITWCSAGHPPPLAEDANGLRYLSSPQRAPLAAQTQSAGPAETGALPPCGLLLLYSDGLVERRGEPFDASLDRLRATVAKHAELPVGQLCDAVLAEMRPEAGFPDDVALVAVRATGQTDSRFVDAFHATPAGLARSRHRLRDWLAGLEIPAGTLIDAVLAISEAAGNAMEHGSGNDPQQVVSVEVSLAGEDNALLAVVGDHGRWDADPTAGAARGRGRGLGIMDRLASELHVRRSRVGSTVTLRFDLPAAGEAPAGVRRPEPAD